MALTGWANTPNVLRMGSALFTAPPFSVSAWCQPASFTSERSIFGIYNSASATNNNEFYFRFDNTGAVKVGAADGSGGASAVSTAVATAGAWTQAGGVWASATDRRAFINGANKGTTSTSKVPSGVNRTSIGLEDNSASINSMVGPIAHIGVWSVALADADMALLGKGISPLLVRRDVLVAYWPLVGAGAIEASAFKNAPMSVVGSLTAVSGPAIIMPKRKLVMAA